MEIDLPYINEEESASAFARSFCHSRRESASAFASSFVIPEGNLHLHLPALFVIPEGNLRLHLHVLLSFPKGICVCICTFFCHSRRESASAFARSFVIPEEEAAPTAWPLIPLFGRLYL